MAVWRRPERLDTTRPATQTRRTHTQTLTLAQPSPPPGKTATLFLILALSATRSGPPLWSFISYSRDMTCAGPYTVLNAGMGWRVKGTPALFYPPHPHTHTLARKSYHYYYCFLSSLTKGVVVLIANNASSSKSSKHHYPFRILITIITLLH